MEEKKRGSFSSQLGFIMAAAGSAVGLGNIWRFPYLAAKDGGGLFIFVYVILALTFGFALLTTEIAIGRNTKQGPLTAYSKIKDFGSFGKISGLIIGMFACLVPTIILPYYCSIGGWVFKYLSIYMTGHGADAVSDGFFGGYIAGNVEPIIWMLIYFGITSFIVISGVEKGIEKFSRILMPILVVMILLISAFSLTLKSTGADGVVRTGLDGLKVYLLPDISGMSVKDILVVVMDAVGQLFFSISVAMGIMIAYGSYAKKETNLIKSINQIEIFDTSIALLAGLMIIPAVFVFMGREGMSAGPGLIFVSLPKVFNAMGIAGNVVGPLFFLIVSFAAVTSSVSVMEAIVSSIMDAFKTSRLVASIIVTVYTLIAGVIVCMGYNILSFVECTLPNGSTAQILDIMDYVSNNLMMPLVAFCESILIGWVVGPKYIIDELTTDADSIMPVKFGRKKLFIIMIKYVVPFILLVLLLNSLGLLDFLYN